MPVSIDALMERASQALVKMDYAQSEALSVQALAICAEAQDWTTYARVVMPLQEARRQRRLVACDAGVSIGGLEVAPQPGGEGVWIAVGVTREQAAEVDAEARERGDAVEVLWIHKQTDAAWTVASFTGPMVAVDLVVPQSVGDAWYLQASEALGDVAIAACNLPVGGVERVQDLAERLAAVLDHEKLHQALAEAARAVAIQPS